jgi:hypothetical protein
MAGGPWARKRNKQKRQVRSVSIQGLATSSASPVGRRTLASAESLNHLLKTPFTSAANPALARKRVQKDLVVWYTKEKRDKRKKKYLNENQHLQLRR